jgi:hypothetical protein
MNCSECNNALAEASTSCPFCGAPVVQTQNSSTKSLSGETSKAVPDLTFVEKLATSGKLASAQAKLEKLKRLDLQTARKELGEAAFGISFDYTRLTDHYDAIRKFGEQIESLRKTTPTDAAASVLEKAKGHAQMGRQALEIESLSHKRKNAFCEIGKLVEDSANPPESLASSMQKIKAIKAEIRRLEREIEELKSRVSGILAKPGRILAVAAAIIVMFIAWNFAMPRYQNWKSGQELERQQNLAHAAIINLDAERKRLEMESLGRQNKMEQEERVNEADRNTQRLAQDLMRKEAETARTIAATNEAEERRLEQARKKMAQATVEADIQRKKDISAKVASETAANEQRNRSALVAKLLGEVHLAPSLTLSGTLQKIGVSVEMRGGDIQKLEELKRSGRWLEFLSCVDGGKLNLFPSVDIIESIAERFQNKQFKIFFKTTYQVTDAEKLYLVMFPTDKIPSGFKIVTVWNIFERHPDGIGYLHAWCPGDGPVVVVSGNDENVGVYLHNSEVAFKQERYALDKKKELGEISDDEVKASLEALRMKAYQTISQWANGR